MVIEDMPHMAQFVFDVYNDIMHRMHAQIGVSYGEHVNA